MLIILDKKTKQVVKNLGTNSLFPDGNLPIVEKADEIHVRLHDDSEFARQILSAYEYELKLNENNHVVNVIVHKSLEEYLAEQPTIPQPPTLEEQLLERDKQMSELKAQLTATEQVITENTLAQQELLELLIDMGVL